MIGYSTPKAADQYACLGDNWRTRMPVVEAAAVLNIIRPFFTTGSVGSSE